MMTKMTYEPQIFTAPDGTEMAILPKARLDALLAIEEEYEDIEAVTAGRASLAEEGGIPLEVDRAIAAGTHPLRAWRKFRALTQTELAEKADVTQAAIARLEKADPGAGKPETLQALAVALDAPLWTLGTPPASARAQVAAAVFAAAARGVVDATAGAAGEARAAAAGRFFATQHEVNLFAGAAAFAHTATPAAERIDFGEHEPTAIWGLDLTEGGVFTEDPTGLARMRFAQWTADAGLDTTSPAARGAKDAHLTKPKR